MKIMYVASKATDQDSLMLEREITQLQLRSLGAESPVVLQFFPDLCAEDLPLTLSKHAPDVLHISAHGERQGLSLASCSGSPIAMTSKTLLSVLNPEKLPRLIYLNACDSSAIARDLSKVVPMAIGTTAPITNRAARASAVAFYDRLMLGFTAQQAFDAGRGILGALQAGGADAVLYHRSDIDPTRERLLTIPRIVASFARERVKKDADAHFRFHLGVVGCRADTVQVVFFTDDESYVDTEKSLEKDLCLVERTRPVRGVIWSDFEWAAYGDFRLFACGATASGEVFSLATTLCDAIRSKYFFFDHLDPSMLPEEVQQALLDLHSMDGADIQPPVE